MKRFAFVLAVVSVVLAASVAQAAIINVSTSDASFAVSSTDIGETSATVTGRSTWGGGTGLGSLANLNGRGAATNETTAGNGSLELGTGAGVSFEPNNSNGVVFTFDLTNAPLGWNVNEITSYASWGGRALQEYSLSAVVTVAGVDTWVDVLPTTAYYSGSANASKVDITNLGLTGVKSLTFSNFGYGPGGSLGNIYHEIDVFGAATTAPEPGTIVLLATALIGLLAYAWRKRK
jgi:hypothetical protein